MSVKSGRYVAVVFDDLTEFFAIRSDVDALIKEGISIDIYVAQSYSNELRVDTQKKISQLGYQVKELPGTNRKYKILLEPYPLENNELLDSEFRIKYSYGIGSAKPDPVFLPERNLPYDAFLLHSKRDAEIRSVYGKTYVIPYSKYKGLKKEKHQGKPNLLYLPTFGEVSSIDAFNSEAVRSLKKKYNLIIKAHHAVQFIPTEHGHYALIKDMADEFYDSDTPLENLLARADVVLSDNSGAIFDAIYFEIPVPVFSNKLNDRKLGGINTFQYELVQEGVIPCATEPEDVVNVLNKAEKLAKIQQEIKQRYFAVSSEESSSSFASVIKEYLSKDRKKDMYLMSRDILLSEYNKKTQKISVLEAQLKQLQDQVVMYENSKSWKVTRPLRKINDLISKEKKI